MRNRIIPKMTHGFYKPVWKKAYYLFLGQFFFGLMLSGQTSGSQDQYNLIVGTYTKPGESEGIYVYGFDVQTGEFNYRSVASGISNPSYLVVSKDRKYVYAVNENRNGSVSSFSFDGEAGKLTLMNQMGSGGSGPCYITTDDRGKYVYVGNYGGGSLSAIPIKPDGALGSSIQSIRHEGKSITPNQTRSHVHATVLSRDGKHLYVPDLGEDKIYIYDVEVNQPNPLTPSSTPYLEVSPGNGPRHLIVHPTKALAYAIHELTGRITVLSTKNGLETLQSVDMTSADYKDGKYEADAADIHMSPDGKFLYGSLRGNSNEIVVYRIKKDGLLEYVERYSTLGKYPRNFVIDPTGNFLLVGNSGSNEIRIFKRDRKTGKLEPMPNPIKVGAPVCLKFVKV